MNDHLRSETWYEMEYYFFQDGVGYVQNILKSESMLHLIRVRNNIHQSNRETKSGVPQSTGVIKDLIPGEGWFTSVSPVIWKITKEEIAP